ncbi:MAG TPA: AAA family ATPase [bacterium]|nr:AAA family ATPase [bacterium]HPN31932.1 AAA family ATPase [bacterium]
MKNETIILSDIKLVLSEPDSTQTEWIGQNEILEQLLACWLIISNSDYPLTPRITGVPGVGKTTLAMSAAKIRNQPLYIFQCSSDTRPEDLLVTPVLDSCGKISYHASPLVTAMIKGGICILDEGNRMNEKSWASLAPLLDYRRYVESVAAGATIKAHQEFRCCVTMNDDESTYQLPDYILSRLNPELELEFPNKNDEIKILKYHLPFAEDELIETTVDFLQEAHSLKLDYSTRDGINIARYFMKRMTQNKNNPVFQNSAWTESIMKILGKEAVDLKKLADKKMKEKNNYYAPIGLEDIFFDDNFSSPK